MDELTLVVATPFKKNASSLLSIKDFEFALSFDLKWMSPDLASKVRDKAIASRMLKFEGDKLTPDFDIDKVEIPNGFKPSENIFIEKGDIEEMISTISAKASITEKEVIAAINNKQEQLEDLVSIEIAGLIVAREMGCDIGDLYERIYDKFFNKE
ncbi:DUF2240 family protein [Methanolobus sp. ZRKC3]|uniref:DUF2240 family protein n=1 Tax=Methanolobus sp. ZRKC3 TaxID=3125786 RepID=UPI003254B136